MKGKLVWFIGPPAKVSVLLKKKMETVSSGAPSSNVTLTLSPTYQVVLGVGNTISVKRKDD